MDKQASQIMGEAIVAGVQLEAPQTVKDAVGGVVGNLLAGVALKEASLPGGQAGIYYVAVGPTKVGFFSVKRGLFKNSLGQMLVEHPRSDVKAVEIKSGMMPSAQFVFADGTNYVLMCARIQLGKLKKIQELLTSA